MAQTDAAALSSYIKQKYSREADDTLIKCAILFNNTDLGSFDRLGNTLQIPVKVQDEQGLSYGQPGSGTARNALPLKIQPASVNVPTLSIQASLTADVVQRTSGGSDTSFGPAVKLCLDSQRESLIRRVEQDYIYGGQAWATVSSITDGGTTATIVLSGYSPSFFSTLVGAELDVYSTGVATRRTANAPIVVTSFNMATNTLSVSGNSTDLSVIVSTDVLIGYGSKGNTVVGLLKQIAFRGDVGFGIDNTLYPSFQGQVFPVNGTLTYAIAAKAVGLAMAFLPEDDLTLFVSPSQFAALVKEQGALIRWMTGGKDADVGFPALDITIGSVKAMVAAHPFLHDADAFVLPLAQVEVAGTSKEVFDTTSAGDMVVWSPSTLSYLYTMMAQVQPVLRKPNQAVALTGLTVAS